MFRHEDISVLISSSPIASHPSTSTIEETIVSVRYHLPKSRIFVMLDGVRPEQEHRRADYVQYIENLLKWTRGMNDIELLPFAEFIHQALMTMLTITAIKTRYVLFVEHDTPLVNEFIDWPFLVEALQSGITNHIRLHYDQQIHPEHQHMMMGKLGDHLIKTIQWHQRPHISRTQWYDEILHRNFTQDSRTFIEDVVYSPVSCSPWDDYRLTVYDPWGTGQNMKRSRDLNGRAGEEKYPMVFR